MQLHIRHETAYRYADAVRYTIQALHLTPRAEARQRIVSWSIQAPGRKIEQVDAHGNVVHYLTVESPHRELRVIVSGVVETDDQPGQPNGGPALISPLAYRAPTALTGSNERLLEFARMHLSHRHDLRDQLLAAAEAICTRIAYRPGTTLVSDPATAAFERSEGVCQDQAHVFIASCRALDIPARYVSGYLHTGDDGALASHAWAEAWLEREQEWFGIDITHRRPVGPEHCRLAVGRDYLDAAPVRGVRRGGGKEEMLVSVLVAAAAQQ
jgi:transglutaminase-like putative cysteine protease